jgi:hypothetical protein
MKHDMRTFKRVVVSAIVTLASLPAGATKCEDLMALKLPETTITSAQVVPPEAFTPSAPLDPQDGPASFKDLPAFCRVAAQIAPTKDSGIKMEVWMPLSGWNGKYQGVGNGGFAGSIFYDGLAEAVRHGYAAAATDTGHSASATDARWALGHPEKIVDFGHRAIHEMTLKAKSVITAFYGDGPKRSYFAGCSNGGRQALMEAQRYPDDYDGIIAGAPANNFTHLLAGAVWDAQATLSDPASYIPASKIPVISAAVRAACDAQDGVKDDLLSDPRKCAFDPATILCSQGEPADSNSCLSPAQIAALKKLHGGARNSKGDQIRLGIPFGGEEGPGGWSLWITGQQPGRALLVAFVNGFFKDMVFDDPNWDFNTFNFDTSVRLTDEKQAKNLNATDPNLKAFKAWGGKLILYHGWSDPAITALGTIDYYNSIAESSLFVRLFLAPGMQHCGGGPGPNSFGQFGPSTTVDPQHSMFSAMEQWVEKGIPPETVIATKSVNGAVKMGRPLCSYPQTAKYKGSGDVSQAENWNCGKEAAGH